MRIALSSINPVIGDFQKNIEQIKAGMARAREAGCQLLILPELVLSGSPPMSLLSRSSFLEAHDQAFARLLATIGDMAVLCGVISRDNSTFGKGLYNSAVLMAEGKIQFVIHKHLLESFGSYREGDYFEKGEVYLPVPFQGRRLGITLGQEIIPEEDNHGLRDIHSPIADFHHNGGADLFINLAATPFTKDEISSRFDRLSGICRKYQTPLLYVNQMGGQDSLLFDGQCLTFNSKGELSQSTPPFEEGMLIVGSEQPDAASPGGEKHPRDLECILRGIVTGIRDYVHKSGFSRVVIGLSGGIDSALTCAAAVRALGPENVLGAALPSEISSPESVADARQLAANLGISFEIIPIDRSLQTLKDTLAPLFQEERDDITEANLQARIRGVLLMALANKYNRLLLATGNKSEVATGYCTLYGDTCGALAPLADVPKTMVYELAALLNRKWGSGSGEIIPGSSLEKAPSAELIPGRQDLDDLPAYKILDGILEAWQEEKLSIAEIVDRGYDSSTVKDVIRRLDKNKFKRHQLPPGLRLTSRAFDFGTDLPVAGRCLPEYD
ncbi:MAG: NAD+ synthase [Desulfurivibrionaceae bacterium]